MNIRNLFNKKEVRFGSKYEVDKKCDFCHIGIGTSKYHEKDGTVTEFKHTHRKLYTIKWDKKTYGVCKFCKDFYDRVSVGRRSKYIKDIVG